MTLCRSFGYSKQAYYRSQRFFSREERECYLVGLVEELRRDLPRLGGVKLWKLLNDNGVRVGRDELFRLLGRYGLLIIRRKRRAVTTDSKGWARQHPNLVKGLKVSRPNQVWVSDITYVTTRAGFVYLSLVTDAYSRRIMGWHVHAGQRRPPALPVPGDMPGGRRRPQGAGPPFGPRVPIPQRAVRRHAFLQGYKDKHDARRLAV